MQNKMIPIIDTELGALATEKEAAAAVKEYEDRMSVPDPQKPSSGLKLDSLRDFQDALFSGDKEGVLTAIEETSDPGTKEAMKRLAKYV